MRCPGSFIWGTMRIAWQSNAPWSATGYGVQTKLFVPRLQALGHDMAILANWGLQAAPLNLNGIQIYPAGFEPYGNDVIAAHSAHFRADVTISLYDSWVYKPEMFGSIRWAPWFPVDHDPLPVNIADKIRRSWFPMTYSRFGERMAADAGIQTTYIPHGVDTELYAPIDRAAAREQTRWPKDTFIVGMVATNKGTPSRKALPQSLQAFAMFHKRHPDSLLYLHMTDGAAGQFDGVNLPELAEQLGISDAVIWADQYALLLSFPEKAMVAAYNAMDVLLACSMGEGFGVPILEAQSCGTPVVVGDWTAMTELCFAGWTVAKEDALAYYTPLASYQFIPQPAAIAEQLHQAYLATNRTALRDRARDGALAYDVDLVTETYWKPALAEMERKVELNTALLAGAR